jgi:hypothetical protein
MRGIAGCCARRKWPSSRTAELAPHHESRSADPYHLAQSQLVEAIHFHTNDLIFSAAFENTIPANTAIKIARFWCCGFRARFILAITRNKPPIAI